MYIVYKAQNAIVYNLVYKRSNLGFFQLLGYDVEINVVRLSLSILTITDIFARFDKPIKINNEY